MKGYLVLLLCSTIMVTLIGCSNTHPANGSKEDGPYLSETRIQFEKGTTKAIVKVVRVDTERIGSGLLKVILTLRNKTKKNLWVDTRTTFLDAKGHVLEQTNWEPILLDARTVSEYTCTSLGNQAADYQIIIRKPKKTSLDMP